MKVTMAPDTGTIMTHNRHGKKRRQVFVRHYDPYDTGEGLGSYARGSLYPLIRVASAFDDWEILWHDSPGFGRQNQSRPFYEEDCRHLAEWLFLDGDDSSRRLVDMKVDAGDASAMAKTAAKVPTFQELDKNRLVVVPIDLENDNRLGRILGYAGILISSIKDYCDEHGERSFFNLAGDGDDDDDDVDDDTIVLVSLNGRFQYKDDPSPDVIRFLQSRCIQWKNMTKKMMILERNIENHDLPRKTNNEDQGSITSLPTPTLKPKRRTVRIAVHIRVPEDYCSQEWKDANSISHVMTTLEILQLSILQSHENRSSFGNIDDHDTEYDHDHHQDQQDLGERQQRQRHRFVLDVYTENSFTKEKELILMEFLRATMVSGNENGSTHRLLFEVNDDDVCHSTTLDANASFGKVIRLHRQTPLLDTVQGMATADIFIPASSYLSAFAGFFQTSLVVLPNESTRRQQYFEPHLSYRAQRPKRKDTNLEDGGVGSSNVTIPIVPIEDSEALTSALTELLYC